MIIVFLNLLDFEVHGCWMHNTKLAPMDYYFGVKHMVPWCFP
jgi:hypothetical protein